MPVRVTDINKKTATRANRGRGFDAAILKLAPTVRQVQSDGFGGIQQISERLKEAGFTAPSGKTFALTTMGRILKRLAEMGLASGPLNSAASRQQAERSRRG